MSVEKLQVDLTVGLSLVVDADLDVPGALLARVSRLDQLKWKDKVGIAFGICFCCIWMHY